MRISLYALLGIALTAAPAVAQQPPMPPKQVGVIELQMQKVPRIVTLPGRAVAGEEAAIRPRVSGMVTEILYIGGSPIAAGAPMFRIDATIYEADVIAAESEVAAAAAVLRQAQATLERARRLVGSGTTPVDVENAEAALEQALAREKAAKAALTLAEAQLGWTTVTSPIDGMASVAEVSVGDLVSAGQPEAMATVTRLDPIDVDMYEPSARILRVYDDIAAGRLQVHDKLKATLTLENGQTYSVGGTLLSPGFTVSTTTGAVDNRFRFENPDRRLLPGMFVRGQIEIGVAEAVLVSQSAATRDRTGQLTAWVVEDGKAVQRQLTDDGTYQNHWIVTAGVQPGDLLVADGFNGLMAGMEVVTVPVIYDDAGVVQTLPAPDAAGDAPAADQAE